MLAVMQSHPPDLPHADLSAAQSSTKAKAKNSATSSAKSSAMSGTQSRSSTPQHDTTAAAAECGQQAPRSSKAANAATGGSRPKPISGKKGKAPAHRQQQDHVFSSAHMLSKPAPSSTAAGSAAPRKGNRKAKGSNAHESADPQWDMPELSSDTLPRQAGQDATTSTGLTWQQQLLASSMNKAASSDGTHNERKRNKNQQSQLTKEAKTESNGSAKTRDQQHKPDAARASAPAPSGLTWQQQTMTSSADQAGRPREAKGQKSDTPIKAQRSTQDQQSKHGSSAPGAKPSTPSKPSSKATNEQNKSHSVSDTSSSLSGPMYAGPSFHSSPSPASLPAPSFARQRPVSLTNEQSVNLSSSSSSNSYNQQQYSSSPLRQPPQDHSHLFPPHFAQPASSFPKVPTTAPLTPSSDWPAYPARQPASDSSSSGDGSANDSAKQQTIETLLARLMR